MNNELIEVAESMETISNNALIWTMVRGISHTAEKNGVTYHQLLSAFEIIEQYVKHDASIMSSDLGYKLDLDGSDGDWYQVPAIG